ncbi:hypothetical protein B0H66DRAFT_601271 [Apodospora peruviana]|uniref:Uncharacterized protein n=1 Tax=Apodospora peruviana TaxID=516989 RepID=A0AAE0IB00_9PEZI|nr:hypothetical protein B0H66DRAFT_601271 [Apodospora peruviana]
MPNHTAPPQGQAWQVSNLPQFSDKANIWGYPFHDDRDDRPRYPLEKIEAATISPQKNFYYGHTGKQNEWAGMSATIELWTAVDNEQPARVCTIEYKCPWTGLNKFELRDRNPGFPGRIFGCGYSRRCAGVCYY